MFIVGIITVSDKGSRGERIDESGIVIEEMITNAGYIVEKKDIIPDDQDIIEERLMDYSDEYDLDLILTTGGTGFSPRDVTPEATENVATKRLPGIAEAMRAYSMSITKRAMLSRATSVIRNNTLIINLPGSPKAVKETLEYILPELDHGLRILKNMDGECAR